MQDVLKLAEEALEVVAKDATEAYRCVSQGWVPPKQKITNGITFADVIKADKALTAIRASRAEWGWRKIAEAPDDAALTVGTWVKAGDDKFSWFSPSGTYQKGVAIRHGYDWFFIVPPPPAREEEA